VGNTERTVHVQEPVSVMVVNLKPARLYTDTGMRNAKKCTPAKRKAVELLSLLDCCDVGSLVVRIGDNSNK
jgi:hypothetical protein